MSSSNGNLSRQEDYRRNHNGMSSPHSGSIRNPYLSGRQRSYGNSPYGPKPPSQYRRPVNQGPRNMNFDYQPQHEFYSTLPYDGPEGHPQKLPSRSYNSHPTHNNNGPVSPRRSYQGPSPSPPSKYQIKIQKNTWLFGAYELSVNSPSILDGISQRDEFLQRSKGVNFIFQVASLLKLPQMVVYAAATFLHRFYLRHSLKRFHYYVSLFAFIFFFFNIPNTGMY